jgi:hypothetical protein
MDRGTGEIPGSMGKTLVAATPSCVAIGTRSSTDGDTEIVFTDEKAYPLSDSGFFMAFTGTIAIPRKRVDVCTADLRVVAGLPRSATECRVAVWTNDRKEPSRICIVVE